MSEHPAHHGDGHHPKKKRGTCRRCLKWLGILLLVFLVLAGIAAALVFHVPQRLGLLPNAAKRNLTYTPDRSAGEEMLKEAQTRGMNTTGARIYVQPYKDGDGTVATAILDSRDGFAFTRTGEKNPVPMVFAQIAGTQKAADLGVKYITVVFVSAKGEDLMNLSASQADAMAYANGSLTEEQFAAKLNGEWNLPAMMGEQIDAAKRMLQ